MPLPAAAAAVSGGLGLISGLLNLFGQSQANKQNVAMQRETNALNYQMFQESQEFARQQQQLAMEYNDPSAQVERLRKAGINPAYVFGNGSVSEVSQASSPSAPNMVAPQISPLDYSGLGSAGQFAFQSYFENELRSSQVDKTKQEGRIAQIQAEMDSAALESRLAMIVNDKHRSDYERETAARHLAILRETQDKLIRQEEVRTDIMQKQADEVQLRNDAQQLANKIADIDLRWHNKEKSANYGLYMANIKQALASARSGDASAAASYASAALSYAQRDGVKVDNEVKERTKDEIVNQAYLESGRKENEKNKSFWESAYSKKEWILGKHAAGLIPEIKYLLGIE